jgi:hypothetical protein
MFYVIFSYNLLTDTLTMIALHAPYAYDASVINYIPVSHVSSDVKTWFLASFNDRHKYVIEIELTGTGVYVERKDVKHRREDRSKHVHLIPIIEPGEQPLETSPAMMMVEGRELTEIAQLSYTNKLTRSYYVIFFDWKHRNDSRLVLRHNHGYCVHTGDTRSFSHCRNYKYRGDFSGEFDFHQNEDYVYTIGVKGR